MMKNASENFFYSSDGLRLFYRHWLPEHTNPLEFLLIVIHGLGEHSGRYENLAKAMLARGVGVAAFDLRGHGHSQGKRGHIRSFKEYLADIRQFIQLCRTLHPQPCKLFLVGHSLGGLIVLQYVIEEAQHLSGVVASGPALKVKMKIPAIKKLIGRVFSSILPSLTLQNEVHPDLLSRDPQVGEAYLTDPLVHHWASTRFYTECLKAMEETLGGLPNLSLPVLFLQGGADEIVDLDVTQKAFNSIKYSEKEIKIYPGDYHEVFNELDKEKVFEDLYQWIIGKG